MIVNVVPGSTSASFVFTLPDIATYCVVRTISSVAKGASFTFTTVMARLPVSEPPLPSLKVYSKTGTAPVYPAMGVKV